MELIDTEPSENRPSDAERFADPVAYLASLGIYAEMVACSPTLLVDAA